MRAALVLVMAESLSLFACRPKPEELLAAVERRDGAAVAKLLDRGADPNAASESTLETALSMAAENGDIPTMKALLAHHADPNATDRPFMGNSVKNSLQHAAHEGQVEAIRLLVSSGARLETSAGESALAMAAEEGHIEAVDALIALGAKVDGTSADALGYPPIVIASEKKRAAIVRRLLDAKAQIDKRDVLGTTALGAATAEEDAETVRVLLAAGADPLAPNRAGWTPAFTAQYHGKEDVLALYRAAHVVDFAMHAPPAFPASGFGTIAVPAVTATAR